MAKARRRLSDLVQEETQKPRATDLQTSEKTNSETLVEVDVENTKNVDLDSEKLQTTKATDLHTQKQKIPNLQTSDVTNPVVSLDVAVEDKGKVDLESKKLTELQTLKVTNLQSYKQPKYLKLERKEARLRQDQIDALTDLTRKLNRKKQGKSSERLTDNTLIRVAIDLLLSKADLLEGTTEDELRRSLTLEVSE
ncbi:hypothetical protein H6G41_30450 [Tolypothrix sp. FACHB-123]|uniref:hypothetical protein n=1 Tax=Tolypothrix sp. FACHB-123 TaxID=2692868 RepID=UPI001687121F|nr:hypothetical protein [Tolypothrix sp. FACHB-123]MBD2358869.1 hypothetical protein [Tolypothrix sp. FACHB-123]